MSRSATETAISRSALFDLRGFILGSPATVELSGL